MSREARPTPRFFHGWYIVFIAFCGYFITAGTSGYTFGQFINPLSLAFGWTVGFVSSMTFTRALTSIVCTPLVGHITDRIGSRPVMLVGVVLGGGAFIAASLIADPILFYIVFTVVAALGYAMLGGIPSQAAITHWFRRRRGMALALATTGISVGGLVMVPLAQWSLDNMGWRFTLAAIGVGIFFVMLAPVFLFMRDTPEQMGLVPDGELPSPPAPLPIGERGDPTAERTWTSREVLRSSNFWKQAVGYMFAFGMLQVTLVYQFPVISSRGFDNATAALLVSLYALCAALSRFLWGYLADKGDVNRVAVVSIWVAAIGVGLLIVANDLAGMALYAIVGGTGISGLAALQTIVTAQSFGRRSFGTVAGLLNPMNQIAGALAVPFTGYLFDQTHTYNLALGIIGVL
ncbi:MAG: MFS transporter, partial [Chloroflexota bacterium]